MESGAYGAANAGGSFDLRRFVSQPQVVTRLVSMVSRPESPRSRASRLPGPVGRRPRSATGGGGCVSGAWRRTRGPAPLRVPVPSSPCVPSPAPLGGSGPCLPNSGPGPAAPSTADPGRSGAGRPRSAPGRLACRLAGSGRDRRVARHSRWPARRGSQPREFTWKGLSEATWGGRREVGLAP